MRRLRGLCCRVIFALRRTDDGSAAGWWTAEYGPFVDGLVSSLVLTPIEDEIYFEYLDRESHCSSPWIKLSMASLLKYNSVPAKHIYGTEILK